jgi:phosphotransferase system enzyme I (PtsP)
MIELVRRRRKRTAAPHVHGRGEARLDAVLDLAEEASRDAPLGEVMARLCERIAGMLAVEVCSIYLRELEADGRRGALVLRATWGYPQSAVGAVRMRVGEGLTGFAVECLRPVSVARAASDARNKAFEELDEARFPSLCAVPLVDGGRAVGALVIQRKQPRRFGQREIVLAASVTAPVLFALERGRSRERELAEAQLAAMAPRGPRPHEVVLRGDGVAPGSALGSVVVRRHAATKVDRMPSRGGDIADERARLGHAMAAAADEVAELEQWALRNAPLDRGTMMQLLAPARFVLDDARLRGRIVKQIDVGIPAEESVERVMREYTRILSSSGDPHLAERALEVEALCQRVMNRLHGPRAKLPAGCVLVASRLTVCDAIELGAAHGVAAALAGPANASPGVAVACALGLPVVAQVRELFRWCADGDRALIKGEEGEVILNPSRVDVAAHRRR